MSIPLSLLWIVNYLIVRKLERSAANPLKPLREIAVKAAMNRTSIIAE